MFNEEETREILTENDFPQFELSYETISHNKVLDANIIAAIPEGSKYYAWFTTYKAENVCFLLEISEKNRQIISSKIVVTSFNDCLSYNDGTILSGTLFLYNKLDIKNKKQDIKNKNQDIKNKNNENTCFCIEDIYFYKGNRCENQTFVNKLKLLKEMLSLEISQTALTSNYVIFGLPLMNTNFTNLIRDIEYLPYKVDRIVFRYFNAKKILYVKYYKPNTTTVRDQVNKGARLTTAVFLVKPDVQPDIYHLYYYKNGNETKGKETKGKETKGNEIKGKEEYYDIACIQEYTVSVMMNRLFRKIKENQNLDALEESDDEEEFQSEKEDKFVFLDKAVKMTCVYNAKFKKWSPVSVAKKTDYIVSDKILF
jgi:hypothetical protein